MNIKEEEELIEIDKEKKKELKTKIILPSSDHSSVTVLAVVLVMRNSGGPGGT